MSLTDWLVGLVPLHLERFLGLTHAPAALKDKGNHWQQHRIVLSISQTRTWQEIKSYADRTLTFPFKERAFFFAVVAFDSASESR